MRPKAWTFVLAIFALGVALRLPAFGRPLLSDDEAIYATTADAMMRGDRLYRDVVDHKPPLIYHVYQAGFAALGRYQTHGAHALVILAVLLTAAFLFRTASREGGFAIGLAAAALWLIFSTTWHDYDALAANCELFLLAPQAAAAWLMLRDALVPSPGARRLLTHLAVGALIGTSALFKYQGLTFLGASVGMLVWASVMGRAPWPATVAGAACQVAGAALPPALYLLACVAAGNAVATVFWFRFNFSYVGAGLTGLAAVVRGLRRTASIGGVALVPYALGLAAAGGAVAGMARAWRGRRQQPPVANVRPSQVLGVLWLITSAIAVTAGGRFFGHYFHLVLAPLCLLASPTFVRLWRTHAAGRAALVALCALPALCFLALATVGRSFAATLDEGEPPYAGVAMRIDALTAPDDRVFVWGNSPQLYILARRPMGTRFSFCNYMTGESPGTPTETGRWNADANQLPVSWDMLFADLEQRQPALLVDAAAAGWDGYDKFPLERYPRLRAYVDAHYRPVEVDAGVVLYRRLRTR